MTLRVDVLHGPNLGTLGRREPEVYGSATLEEIDAALRGVAEELEVELHTFQSNHEGELLDHLESLRGVTDGVVVNGAGLTHTSVVLRDGLVALGRPFVEVHLSNTAAREGFRRRSYLSPVAEGVVYGFGVDSYLLGLRGIVAALRGDGAD